MLLLAVDGATIGWCGLDVDFHVNYPNAAHGIMLQNIPLLYVTLNTRRIMCFRSYLIMHIAKKCLRSICRFNYLSPWTLCFLLQSRSIYYEEDSWKSCRFFSQVNRTFSDETPIALCRTRQQRHCGHTHINLASVYLSGRCDSERIGADLTSQARTRCS